MRTAKELAEYFAQLPQDEMLWCIWVDKSEIADIINGVEFEYANGNLVEELDSKDISNEMYREIMSSVDGADYVWDRFNDDLRDTAKDVFSNYLDEKENAKEDEQLWDKE